MRHLAILFLAAATASCASAPHTLTVSIVSAHSILSAIQDAETPLVCSRPSAPPPPACVPLSLHHQISSDLAQAFDLDGQIASAVRALPPGASAPAFTLNLVAHISSLVSEILSLIPASPSKASLTSHLSELAK